MKKEIWNPRDWSTQPKLIHSGYKSTKLRNPKNPLLRVNLGDYTKGPYFLQPYVAAIPPGRSRQF